MAADTSPMAIGYLREETRADVASRLPTDGTKVWVMKADRAYHTSSQCSAIDSDFSDGSKPQGIMKAMAVQAGYTMCRWCRAWLEA